MKAGRRLNTRGVPVRNMNDRIFEAILERVAADRWLAAQRIRWSNPLAVWWYLRWFIRVRRIHYAVNYWRMVGVMERYHRLITDVVGRRDR